MTLIVPTVDRALSRIGEIRALAGSDRFGVMLSAATSEQPAHTFETVVAQRPVSTDEPIPAGAHRWLGSIKRAAERNGVDPDLLTALVWTESSFVPDAVSSAGAIGLTQLMPGTADILGVDPYDPEQNLDGGARFLRDMIDRFGRVDLALAAYNAGPARVAGLLDDSGAVPVSQTYVDRVLDRQRALGGSQ